jgi:antitoxin (DNA-binding transcriptional repressor) of toxin-antitoxin stability system
MVVNISEAKTNLSKLIEKVYHGEHVTIAKNNLPIADLVIHQPKGKRKLGLAKGKVYYNDDIMAEDETITNMFYGRSE